MRGGEKVKGKKRRGLSHIRSKHSSGGTASKTPEQHFGAEKQLFSQGV